MTVKGVLFDFSGTLLRVEPVADWLRAVLDEAEVRVPEDEFGRYARLLEEAGALPGGPSPRALPPSLEAVWRERDRTPELHRAAYTAVARTVPLPREELYDALYDRHMRPEAWRPYADTRDVLAALRERGVPVAVVSNIGWDLRPVFRAHELAPYVREYVLSYEHGVQKPEPGLFRAGCEALGLAPEDVLMVGDDREADGGAADIGCAVHFVDHLPVELRPGGLVPLLDRID
ncbi:HAD family hydrolase [Streptomyces phytohabitans]|uniref:HAD family hydrolase n=1 Tax=Streptomyces phytohabitans TaxID=1150371 RepID=UPI00345C529A